MNNNNQNLGKLTLEQQFQLEVLRKDIENMSLEQAKEYGTNKQPSDIRLTLAKLEFATSWGTQIVELLQRTHVQLAQSIVLAILVGLIFCPTLKGNCSVTVQQHK